MTLEINDPPVHFHKPAFQQCKHQGRKGCELHGTQHLPRACAVYRCMWLLGWGKPKHRPDRLGLIVECPITGGGIWATETRRGALKEKRAKTVVQLLQKSSEAVIVRPFMSDDESAVFNGTGEQARAILKLADKGALFRDPRLPLPE